MKVNDKAQILNTLYLTCSNREEWTQFFKYADLGIPAAIMFLGGYFEMNPKVEELINDTYDVLLKVLELPDVEYESLDQLFESALEGK